MSDVCEHGSLRRQCDRCEMQARIAELERLAGEYRDERDRLRKAVNDEQASADWKQPHDRTIAALAELLRRWQGRRLLGGRDEIDIGGEVQAIRDGYYAAVQRAEKAERELADALAWTVDDKPIPEDDAIRAARPCETGRHDVYAEAMRLVGAKRSKGALVDLVNWLLAAWQSSACQIAACAPYLKDGETPAECIARNRGDVDAALSRLSERMRELYETRLSVRALRAERDRLRELVDDAIQNQRCDAPGWFTWWTAWVLRATALRDGREG